MLNDTLNLKQFHVNEIKDLMTEAGVPRLLAKVFLDRGITDADYIKKFLNPSLKDLYDPFLMIDMERATNRIQKALDKKEKVTIYGDYDVDGVTSVSILYDFLKSQGADVDFYIPNRCEEGYGMSCQAIDKIKETGTSLVITVDCGVTNFEEVLYIKENQMDVVVTDHHLCMEELPEADAVVNPHRNDCSYPFKDLAGVGVAFKLIHALCIKMSLGDAYMQYLDLVAIGTVADIVPLLDENRAIVKFGLSKVSYDPNLGVSSLLKVLGFKYKLITPNEISYMIAPKINAAGRVSSAEEAVNLFTSKTPQEAEKYAKKLEEYNKARQEIESKIYKQVVEAVESDVEFEKDTVIVVHGEGWHHGIVGIVASRIVEKYSKPCILISLDDEMGRGSGRSIEGFNLFEALKSCDVLLQKFGGHDCAVGVTVKLENIKLLREAINRYAKDIQPGETPSRECTVIEADEEDLCIESVKQLENLEPYGVSNPKPIFIYKSFTVDEIRTVGADGKHLKMRIPHTKGLMDAIGFSMGDRIKDFGPAEAFDALCNLEINTWNYTDRVQLKLLDIKPNQEMALENTGFIELDSCLDFSLVKEDNNSYTKQFFAKFNAMKDLYKSQNRNFTIDDCVPERNDLAAVYKYILKNKGRSFGVESIFKFAREITANSTNDINYFKLKKILEIFEELELILKSDTGEQGLFVTVKDVGTMKVDLESSALYRELRTIRDQF